MKYLLDTHAAIWLLEGSRELGRGAKEALAGESSETVAIADMTLLEIAMLHQRQIIELKPTTAAGLAAFARRLIVLPIDAQIAADAANSPLPQRDPFDRVIVATAQRHDLTLVTRDERIIAAKLVPTVW